MSRKKTPGQIPPSTQQFSHSPFKNLKGLSASKSTSPLPSSKGKTTHSDQKPDPKSGDQHSFADEMEFLGVKPLPGRAINREEPEPQPSSKNATQAKLPREERERVEFLEAVGSMAPSFEDEWTIEPEPAKQNVPRRMKQVERGQLKPEAKLDLHGMTVHEAIMKADYFLQNGLHHNLQTVLIVTGKGLHSSGHPVLRSAIEKFLAESAEAVLEWGVAPRRYGGDGALIVFLRRPTNG